MRQVRLATSLAILWLLAAPGCSPTDSGGAPGPSDAPVSGGDRPGVNPADVPAVEAGGGEGRVDAGAGEDVASERAANDGAGVPDAQPGPDGADGLPGSDTGGAPVQAVDVVAVLSGDRPIDAVGRLTNRWTAESKQRTRAYLMAILSAAGLTPREHMFSSSIGPGINIYVELPATAAAPTDMVIYGAHYDTVPGVPGAIDNATGTAMVYAVARKLGSMPDRRRPAIMAFFDVHETGTMEGSARFAEFVMARNMRVHSVHTLDQIGWDGNGDRGVEIEQPSAGLAELYRTAAQPLGIPVANSSATSDHAMFRNRGFAAIGLSEQYRGGDTTPYYHNVGDRFSTVNLPFFESSLKLVLAVVDVLFAP